MWVKRKKKLMGETCVWIMHMHTCHIVQWRWKKTSFPCRTLGEETATPVIMFCLQFIIFYDFGPYLTLVFENCSKQHQTFKWAVSLIRLFVCFVDCCSGHQSLHSYAYRVTFPVSMYKSQLQCSSAMIPNLR